MTAETRNLGEVEGETVHEPIDGLAGLASENLDQVISCKVTSRLLGVFEEGLGRVWDALLCLCGGTGTVDTGSGLGGVTTEEGLEKKGRAEADQSERGLECVLMVKNEKEMAAANTYVLVEDEHVGSSLVEGVSGTETGETATDNDDARHCGI